MWLNIQDLKMLDGLAPRFITKYVRPYKIFHKLHPNMYTLKLLVNFVAHPTFHVSKLDRKQRVQPKGDAIEHRLAIKIKGIFHARQTHLRGKEYLVNIRVTIIRR